MSYKFKHKKLPETAGFKMDKEAQKCIDYACGKKTSTPTKDNAEKKTSGYIDNTDKRCP